jgi:hypothetical protein
MDVRDAGGGEASGQRLARELREPARARKAAHVGQRLDAVLGQQAEQLADGAGRVTDGVKSGGHSVYYRCARSPAVGGGAPARGCDC